MLLGGIVLSRQDQTELVMVCRWTGGEHQTRFSVMGFRGQAQTRRCLYYLMKYSGLEVISVAPSDLVLRQSCGAVGHQPLGANLLEQLTDARR